MPTKHKHKKDFERAGVPEHNIAPVGQLEPRSPPGTKHLRPGADSYLVEDEDWEGSENPIGVPPKEGAEQVAQKVRTHGYITRLLANCGVQAKPKTVIQAATSYFILGSFRLAAEDAGVMERSLRRWAEKEWWPEVMDYVGQVIDLEYEADMTRIAGKALKQIEDRIDNGDDILFKGEAVGKKRLNGTELTKIFSVAFDKRLLHRGARHLSQNREATENQNTRLEEIASTILEVAQGLKTEKPVIEGQKVTTTYEKN